MINRILPFLTFLTFSCTKAPLPKVCSFNWDVKKIGTLNNSGTASDIKFLSDTEVLVISLPPRGKEKAPLEIYTLKDGNLTFDKEASKFLPLSLHPRQIILEDLDADGSKEIVIADHGTDLPPYDSATPIILRKKGNYWRHDPSSQSMGNAFTFNVAALPAGNKGKGIYRANVGRHGPIFFENLKGKWIDSSYKFPKELSNGLCYMTAHAEDFDLNGSIDFYLGGCDTDKESTAQIHDRILSLQHDKWIFAPVDSVPARKRRSDWGTVFIKSFNLNNDQRPDLLIATHDYSFHNWQINALENKSAPGSIKFAEVELPLIQEKNTEGFVYAIEDFIIDGSSQALMIEVRSVIRDKTKIFPQFYTRFMVRDTNGYVDYSSCLPEHLKKNKYTIRKFPGEPEKLLLVPYSGDIFSLTVNKTI